MHKVHPTKNPDGSETVRLYGKTVDVTGKKKFTLFKKDYQVVRPKTKKHDNKPIGLNAEQATHRAIAFSKAAAGMGMSAKKLEAGDD